MAAVKAGKSVYRSTLAELVEMLARTEREGRLLEKISFLSRSSLLIVDEVGYVLPTLGGANLFFQLINARYEKGALILTSKRLIHHKDHGVQYISLKYTEQLAEAGLQPSVGSVGDSCDNAPLAETVTGLCTGPRRSAPAVPGAAWKRWRWPTSSESIGSTTDACWNRSKPSSYGICGLHSSGGPYARINISTISPTVLSNGSRSEDAAPSS